MNSIKHDFFTVSKIVQLMNDGKLRVEPRYQRAIVWVDKQQKMLVDSILRGYPIPMLILHKKDDIYWIIDGQQRIESIWNFSQNKFRLLNPEFSTVEFLNNTYPIETPWANKNIENLEREHKKSSDGHLYKNDYAQRFFDYDILVNIIEDANDYEIRDLFLRLQKGSPLNKDQQNDIIDSRFNDFIIELAGKQGLERGHDFFNELCIKSKRDKAQLRKHCAQLFMSMSSLTINNKIPPTGSDDIRRYIENENEFDFNSEAAKVFIFILDYLWNSFEFIEKKFNKHESLHLFLFVKSLLDLNINHTKDDLFDSFIKFRKQYEEAGKTKTGVFYEEYVRWTSTASDNPNNITRRHKFFCDKMLEIMFGADYQNNIKYNLVVEDYPDFRNDNLKQFISTEQFAEGIRIKIIFEAFFVGISNKDLNYKNNLQRQSTPSASDYAKKVVELKNKNFRTWKSICEFLNIETAGDSARRKLQRWVSNNKPSWPSVPEE